MHGQCIKCRFYGIVEKHHPLPCRWFGGRRKDKKQNSWTETLCPKCHYEADEITLVIDADYGITNECEARYYKQVFIDAFSLFMNQEVRIKVR